MRYYCDHCKRRLFIPATVCPKCADKHGRGLARGLKKREKMNKPRRGKRQGDGPY